MGHPQQYRNWHCPANGASVWSNFTRVPKTQSHRGRCLNAWVDCRQFQHDPKMRSRTLKTAATLVTVATLASALTTRMAYSRRGHGGLGIYFVISIIIPPPDAAQVCSPSPLRQPPRLDRLDMRILDEIRGHGCYGCNPWTALNAIALEEAPKGHQEQRRRRLELWAKLRALLHHGALYRFGRHCISATHIRREPTVRRKRSSRAGSALARVSHAEVTAPPNHLSLNLLAANARYERKKETYSAPGPGEVTQAARQLAGLPRGPKRWSGMIHGRRAFRGMPVKLSTGWTVFVYGAVRGQVSYSYEAGGLVGNPFEAGLTWGVAPVAKVQFIKNEAAVALGRAKKGVRERKSLAKAAAARINGLMPCRPGRRRGRPPKNLPRC